MLEKLITKEQRILDVGSGDGRVFQALRKKLNITGICLDNKFEMIVECMKKGISAIQMNASDAFDEFADDTFDLVLMNQSIQQLKSALFALKQILRLAPSSVVNFPNFAYIDHIFSHVSIFTFSAIPENFSFLHA